MIVQLGHWVLHEATRQVAAWVADHGPDAVGTLAVNASAKQLQDPTFADSVAAALRETGLVPSTLTIEITESTAVGGGAAWDNLRALRDQGVRVALDNFGTGRSTLSLLLDCPVDQIKLDRRFTPTPENDAIATAVLQLAHDLGIEVVAEGVESSEQAEDLNDLGYAYAQGFHFVRPMPAAAVATFLRQQEHAALSHG